MFGSNVYVIRSPELVYSIQRQPKSLSFWYFEAHFTAILAGFSEAAAAACVQGVRPEATEECPIIELLKDTKTALSPNGDLNRMTAVATKAMHDGLEGLLGKRGQPIDLESWIRHEVLIATTDAVYGTGNPYHKAKVQAGFW